MNYLDPARLRAFDAVAFRTSRPYPWINPDGLLTLEGHRRLLEALPPVSQFTPMFNIRRKHGQQSHDRYGLEYHPELAVAECWHEFVRELQGSEYTRFLQRMLRRRFFSLRFHWHYTPNGCSISPHCDSKTKFGSHIFYFNSAADWDPSWGGQTVLLDDGGRMTPKSAPRFEDFEHITTAETLGNRSLLFARGRQSWHGMREIHCPPHAMRRVFIVVINAAVRTAARDLMRHVLGQPAKDY